ncbi:MAG TPA: hypothetical protein VFZ97_08285 [Acidimicrobiales bacterium]
MDEDVATQSTRLLRESDDPVWVRLRELLTAKGLEPGRIALADFFPDDTDMEFGIAVTPEGHVYEFDFRYGKGDLRTAAATATISDWRDRTDWWRDTPSRQQIEAAFRLLARESASRRIRSDS